MVMVISGEVIMVLFSRFAFDEASPFHRATMPYININLLV